MEGSTRGCGICSFKQVAHYQLAFVEQCCGAALADFCILALQAQFPGTAMGFSWKSSFRLSGLLSAALVCYVPEENKPSYDHTFSVIAYLSNYAVMSRAVSSRVSFSRQAKNNLFLSLFDTERRLHRLASAFKRQFCLPYQSFSTMCHADPEQQFPTQAIAAAADFSDQHTFKYRRRK